MVNDVQTTIQKALGRLHSEKAKLDRQISALQAALTTLGGPGQRGGVAKGRRRKMSAEARRAIAKRMTAYWAKRRAGSKGKVRATA